MDLCPLSDETSRLVETRGATSPVQLLCACQVGYCTQTLSVDLVGWGDLDHDAIQRVLGQRNLRAGVPMNLIYSWGWRWLSSMGRTMLSHVGPSYLLPVLSYIVSGVFEGK